ncbi:MAG: Lar family restriction alleviation protein [Candidatus Hydrogenedentes bacterium]|nr:Lar family restriction alleviation protein [Candidatus Hydrogenedentota bacterium]
MHDRIVFHFDNCPFCGSLDLKCWSEPVGMGDHTKDIFFIYCATCEAKGPLNFNKMKAHEAWNKRKK